MRKILYLSLALAASLYAENSLDETNSQKKTLLDTIVVSADGFEKKLQNEARNIIVITEEEINKRGFKTLEDVLKHSPGISVLPNVSGSSVDMRGQGTNANIHVKVLQDGIELNMVDSSHTGVPLESISINEVERIEIIPGGGAVLYGGGTQGGIVNIITKKGKREPYARFSTKYGSNKYRDIRGNFGSSVSETLFLRGNLYAQKGDGYRDLEKSESVNFGFGLDYNPNDAHSFSFDASYYEGKMDTANSVTKTEIEKYGKKYAKSVSKNKITRLNLTGLYRYTPNDNFEIKFQPFYRDTEFKSRTGYSVFRDEKYGAKLSGSYDYSLGNIVLGYDFMINDGKNDADMRFSMPVMKTLPNGKSVPVMKTLPNGKRVPVMRAVANDTRGVQKKTTHSLYALNRFDITDDFSLSLGYRYEHADYDVKKNTFSNLIIPRGVRTITHIDKSEENHAFEITPNFNYSDTGNIYFKYERGFTSPSVNKMTNKLITQLYDYSNIDSETYDTYEIGIKDLLWGHYFSATAFYTETKDEISTTGRPPVYWKQENIGKTERYGFELMSEQIFDRLRLKESFSYIHTEIKEHHKKSEIGKKIQNVPEYKLTLSANYDFSNALSAYADYSYFGEKRISGTEKKENSYGVLDIGVRYKYKDFSITGGVNNLFDKEYYENSSYSVDGRGVGDYNYAVADGRTFFVELAYEF